MCTNYAPVQQRILREIFGVEPPPGLYKEEIYPDYAAPLIRAAVDGPRESTLATFGMVPRTRTPPGARRYDTTNARSETVGERPTFAKPWRQGQLCLVPASAFYEFAYPEDGTPESPGKPVRWKIWLPETEGFGIAGLWRAWPDDAVSFTLLTVNADLHPILNRMHRPGTEKRSVVVVPEPDWDDWLRCRDPELARSFLRLFPAGRMRAEPAPVVAPARSAAPPAGQASGEESGSKRGEKPDPSGTGSLF
ncbi:SOS response-associated peptidase [Cupriavidus sp. RAF12]|uniref:SOS response-associated peptidase n=1 Tax=Cupriavidus sp. RAF12 TaxID=3233050 RepID=UPI003F9315E4